MVEIENLDRLILKLENIENVDLSKALDEAGYVVENQAKINCPVDTGQLRQSIEHEVKDNSVEIGTSNEYAWYVHEGTGLFAANGNGRQSRWAYQTPDGEWHSTVGQHPQPFLADALHQQTRNIEAIIKNEVRKELEENGKH